MASTGTIEQVSAVGFNELGVDVIREKANVTGFVSEDHNIQCFESQFDMMDRDEDDYAYW